MKKKLLKIATASCLLLWMVACTKDDDASSSGGGQSAPPEKDGYTLAVAPDNQQQIKGWGMFPGHSMPAGSDLGWKSINTAPNAREVLFGELGANMYRVSFEPQCGLNYTANNRELNAAYVDELAELINYAKTKGVTEYLVSIWSPPHHMKEVYDAGSGGGHAYRPRLKKSDYDLFIAYMVDMVKALVAKGCPPPVAISLQNEPEGAWGNNTPVDVTAWTSWYEGVELAQLITKMRTELDKAGLQSVRMGGSESPSYAAWITLDKARMNHAQLKDMDIVMVHSYTEDVYNSTNVAVYRDPLDKFLENKSSLGKESWQTEYSAAGTIGAGKSKLEATQISMRIFASDMVWAQHVVWMWWYGWQTNWSIDRDDYEVLVSGDGSEPVRKSPLYEAFSTIFNNVPRGSYVRKVTTDDTELKTIKHLMNDLVAFQTDAGTLIMLVNSTIKEKAYNVSGLTGTTGQLKSITGDEGDQVRTTAFTVHEGKVWVSIPPRSVNFIITKR
jgi:O-glycosyl hydrolase